MKMAAAGRLPTQDDCTSCGACCCNPDENRAEGFIDYVEVLPHDALFLKIGEGMGARRGAASAARSRHNRKALTHLVVFNDAGVPHMRLDERGACVALRGRLGERVTCTIYQDRPTGCRRVMAGSDRCLLARRERGVVNSRQIG